MLTHVSATSIQLFKEGCNRRWFERYVLGKKGESSPAMVMGNKVHTELENYLNGVALPKTSTIEGKIANAGLNLLPTPHKNMGIEISLDDYQLENSPVKFKGFIDLFIPSSLQEDKVMEILDHKTTSNFKYAKTEEELKKNLQLIIYAKHIMKWIEGDEIRLTHVSYLTKTPYKAIKRSVVVSRKHIDEQFESILKTVHLMLEASEQDVYSMEKNEKFCWSYGKKCPYYDDCMITSNNKGIKNMSKKHLQVIDILRGDEKTEPVKEEKKETVNDRTVLYIGCRPLNAPVTLVSKVIEPIVQEICEKKDVEHISFIPYAQGYDLLNACLLKDGLKNKGAIYIDSNSSLYSRIGETLLQLSEEVVTVS